MLELDVTTWKKNLFLYYEARIFILFKWFYLNCGQEVRIRMNKFNKYIYGVPYIVNLTRLFIIVSNKDKMKNAS